MLVIVTDLFALLFFPQWIFLHHKIINCILHFSTQPCTLSACRSCDIAGVRPLKIKLSLFMTSLEEVQNLIACGIFILFI